MKLISVRIREARLKCNKVQCGFEVRTWSSQGGRGLGGPRGPGGFLVAQMCTA